MVRSTWHLNDKIDTEFSSIIQRQIIYHIVFYISTCHYMSSHVIFVKKCQVEMHQK